MIVDDAPPTMLDLARALGVSHATVSKALRGDQGRTTAKVSAATRARVLAMAAEIGYVPPPFQARYRGGRW